MFGFGKSKKASLQNPIADDAENTLEAREAELDELDLKIEEALLDIFEESRNRRFKLPSSARRK